MDLRKKRKQERLTIYDVEKETGIQASSISLFERDYRKPSDEQKKKLAKTLRTTVKELFG